MEKRGAFVVLSLVFFVLLLLILPSVLSVIDNTTLRDSLLDEDFRGEIRETDSVRVPSTDNLLFKSYDASEKSLLIEDDNFDMVVELKLLTGYNIHVGVGEDIKVAEFLLVDYSSGGDLFEVLNFYDVNDGYKEVEKSFVLKYAVDSLVEGCDSVESFDNDTGLSLGVEDVCYSYITTSWVGFNSLSEIPSKNVRVGVFTDTALGEHIEWVPTVEGFEVLEWASYLVDGLIAYCKMDDNLSTTNVVNEVGENGTLNGGDDTGDLSDDGIIETALHFNGIDDGVDLGDILDTDNIWSISVWFKLDGTPDGYDRIMEHWDNSAVSSERWALAFLNNATLFIQHGTDFTVQFIQNVEDTDWHHVVMLYSGTNVDVYFDGSPAVNFSSNSSVNSNISTWVGEADSDSQPFNGFIDEIGIWNRVLNTTEVADLYNNGSGLSYPFEMYNYTITFNLTDSGTGEQLDLTGQQDDYSVSCDDGFSNSDINDNPYNATNFGNGVVECTFSDLSADMGGANFHYRDKILNITADSNKTVEIPMSRIGGLTEEEHDWLEAVYGCIINGVGCA